MTTNKAALEAEATGENVREFQYKNKTYKINGDPEQWALEAMEAYEDGKSVAMVRALLGPDQWAQFMRTRPATKDFADFLEILFKTIGVEEGE